MPSLPGQEEEGGGADGGRRRSSIAGLPTDVSDRKSSNKLGTTSGVFIPVYLNIMSILMFLRFGLILGQVGFVGILGLLVVSYAIDLLTTLSLSAIASNGEVKGGGAYFLISRSLGPEFGGSIGIMFYLAQVLNTAMNVVGLIDCIRLNVGPAFPHGYWTGYGLQTAVLILCTCMCFLGSATFSKASNGLLAILSLAIVSIPISSIFKTPFYDEKLGINFTGLNLNTLANNFLPHANASEYKGITTFRELFGILFPATSGIFAGASMSGDLLDPSRSIPRGTLWAMLTTFITYFVVIFSMAASTTHESFLANPNVISLTNLSKPVILAGECAVTFFSALMGLIGSAKLFQALARDRLLPGLGAFGKGTRQGDEPILAIILTYAIAQVALLADLNQIATFISMGYQMTFFVMNLACFLLKIGSAPNFRPGFKFFNWQTAFVAGLLSAAAMFFIDETYAAIAICVLVLLFLLIHYLSPPKRWGDVSQNLIYHQVRKYLLRLRPEHIKFWRPHIILLINNPRRHTRLIQFCNSLKKGSLYILGHVIVTDDFNSGVHEAKLQQQAWTNYICEFSKIKAFIQLTMSPTINWGIRNLILSAGLGGMRPNIAVLGFYNMDDLRKSNTKYRVPEVPMSPAMQMRRPPNSNGKAPRRRGDTSARLMSGFLPTDVIKTEEMMTPTQYMTILEDLALRYRLNVAVGNGFEKLQTPRSDGENTKKYIDLWPIQMSAEVTAQGKNVLTTNFDTYTLILQLGHILHTVQTWRQAYSLRVMVFVEYQSEVKQERVRVKALLEKLRIEAEVKVFYLSSGNLNSYELIIQGVSHDIDWEIMVNDALRDQEWWDDLQMFRGRAEPMSYSQEADHLATIYDSTSGRPGIYNPHDEGVQYRRTSVAHIPDIPKRPDLGVLSKMGVNMGIHTHHLQNEMLDESETDEDSEMDHESSLSGDEEMGMRFGDDYANELRTSSLDPTRRPLLAPYSRPAQSNLEDIPSEGSSERFIRLNKASRKNESSTPSYGTVSSQQTVRRDRFHMSISERSSQHIPEVNEVGPSPQSRDDSLEDFPAMDNWSADREYGIASQSEPPSSSQSSEIQSFMEDNPTSLRPSISRQSSAVRFSSRLVPETQVVTEAEGTRIGFAPTADRPSVSRQSSLGKFSSRPMPETVVTSGDGGARTISFAEQASHAPRSGIQSYRHSRQNSVLSQLTEGEQDSGVPDLLGSYKLDPTVDEETEPPSAFSAQNIALSFNELPSRAQHLILNELMRQNSKDTAVLLSTLPIPSEGTSLDEMATIQYLSDVEVLCSQLPPTMLVLSNNMTVTVSL